MTKISLFEVNGPAPFRHVPEIFMYYPSVIFLFL